MEAPVPFALKSPICVALDTPDLGRARSLLREVRDSVGLVKIGMELFYAHGAGGYAAVAAEGVPLFLDLKLHDIPNTVAAALKSLLRLSPPPAIIDVHATGGGPMMQAAAEAVAGRSRLVAVTVLTSLADADLTAAGFDPGMTAPGLAESLARLSKSCGLDGVVCSPHDVANIRAACGPDFLTIVPGIRPPASEAADQKRIATPGEARRAGADILVIGRPITAASAPGQAARDILASLEE